MSQKTSQRLREIADALDAGELNDDVRGGLKELAGTLQSLAATKVNSAGSVKTILRSEFDKLPPLQRSSYLRAGGTLVD